jgi:hypothetical protein
VRPALPNWMIVDTNLTHECPTGILERRARRRGFVRLCQWGRGGSARAIAAPRAACFGASNPYAGRPSRSRRCGTRGHDELWEIAADWRQGEAQVSTWLYRVVANLCTDRLRKRRGVSLDQIAEPTDPQMSATAQMQETSRLTALANALAQLPDRQA